MIFTKNIKTFLFALIFTASFFGSINILQEKFENAILTAKIAKNPPLSVPEISEFSKTKLGYYENITIEAESAILIEISKSGSERISFEKNADKKMPIASLSKLMTAIIADEFYQPFLETQISKSAIAQKESIGDLTIGETLRVNDLLHIALMESSNDAAFAIAEIIGQEGFTQLMNLKAQELGMTNTYFSNPMGLDPDNTDNKNSPPNISTLKDLVKLSKYLLTKQEILDILATQEYVLYLENGLFHHKLENTNQLLGGFEQKIYGKTGYTDSAGGCLIVISQGKLPDSYIISGVLNSADRFFDIRKLIE